MTEMLGTAGAAPVAGPATRAEDEDRTAAAGGKPHDATGDEAAPTAEVGGPFFADLVRAHYRWERELAENDETSPDRLEQLERDYRDKLKEFREAEGDIL